MGFLTDDEAESLRLARMSLHLVGGEEEFEPQPELPVEHDDFLLKILRDIASDSVFQFKDRSVTRSTLEQMASRTMTFQDGAQALAEDFCRLHRGRHRDGAFFVFELGVNDSEVRIYALVKYDYSQALELVHKEGTNGLRRIVEAFSNEKSSIQKSAVIRTADGIAEPAVSTRDRMGRPAPALTDYFQDYLQVERSRDDRDLTLEVKELIRTALKDHKEFLTDGMAVSVSRGFEVLRTASEVNEEVIKQAVWVGAGQPDDTDIQNKLNAAVDRLVKRKRLSGLSFAPQQEALRRSIRLKVTTEEGVTIEYDKGLEGQAVVKEDLGDGTTRFVVTTKEYKDDVIPDRPGRTAR